MHRARGGAWSLLIVACVTAAAGCGSTPAPAGAAAPTGATAKVSLDITVTGAPGTAARHWTLRCDPAGGTHPDAAAACAVLLRAKSPFAPVPRGAYCPMIVLGARVAKVKGTYFGQRIDTTFTEGGCQLARWEKIRQVFP